MLTWLKFQARKFEILEIFRKIWKFPRWFELEKILEERFETKHQNLAIHE